MSEPSEVVGGGGSEGVSLGGGRTITGAENNLYKVNNTFK